MLNIHPVAIGIGVCLGLAYAIYQLIQESAQNRIGVQHHQTVAAVPVPKENPQFSSSSSRAQSPSPSNCSSGSDIEKCSICLSSLENAAIETLKCKHSFHMKCITRWMYINATCPTCRNSIS